MNELTITYPQAPVGVPDALLIPTRTYKRHVWLAVAAILAFIFLYGGLLGYFAWFVYRVFGGAMMAGQGRVQAFFVSLPAMFFLSFLLQGLFAFRRGQRDDLVEIFETDEPQLFLFLRRVSQETGAPFPHRVFLSARVNAGVFYDVSLRNLLWPTEKNLELGLGVVNVLSIDEFKAVIAREFGHFAQKSMAVGRWVYIAHQVANQILSARGRVDAFLNGLSVQDVRIAWIGWLLRIFVWAIRAILDTSFLLVVLAHRALGREMEFAADRVAVASSGSDSIVHALYRLGPADEAWRTALGSVMGQLQESKTLGDLFAVQSEVLSHLRHITAEPSLGCTPSRAAQEARTTLPDQQRVFETSLAQPPQMWSTHPANRDREDNAKAIYMPSHLVPGSAWELFVQPEQRRHAVLTAFVAMSRKPMAGTKVPLEPAESVPTVSSDATKKCLEKLADDYGRAALQPRHQGAFMGRALALYFAKSEQMFGVSDEPLPDALSGLYPPSLRELMKRFREQRANEALLKGLADGFLTAPGGVVRYQGREIKKTELEDTLLLATAERKQTQEAVLEHDKQCRTVYRRVATELGQGWREYHTSIVQLLHCVSHAARRVADAHDYVHHVLAIVFADGSVSNSERKRVLVAATDLREVLAEVWPLATTLVLPTEIRALFEVDKGFISMKQKLGLGTPTEAQLGPWLAAMDGWANGAKEDLQVLANVALDALLELEHKLGEMHKQGNAVIAAPSPAEVPPRYSVMVYGDERERQKHLGWWDKFQIADGFFAGVARLVAACVILVPALVFGTNIGSADVHVYNALPVAVVVHIGHHNATVLPTSAQEIFLEAKDHWHVRTTTTEGDLIEEMDVETSSFGDYVYNVGNAALLVEWTATYGRATAAAERPIGAPRWYVAEQGYVLREPPRTMSSRSGSSSVRVLSAVALTPEFATGSFVSPADRLAAIASWVRFAPIESEQFQEWAVRHVWDAEEERAQVRQWRNPRLDAAGVTTP